MSTTLFTGAAAVAAAPALFAAEPKPAPVLPPLPDTEGFAGAYAGVSHGALIAAGGANFPGKKPWEGGTKVWYDLAFVLDRPDGRWRSAGRLPRPLGYGVSVTHGDGVVCAGGSDAGRHYDDVFRLEWTGEKLAVTPLPELPRPVANGCGALVGDTLYVAGGQDAPDAPAASDRAFALDLAAAKPQWRELPKVPVGRILGVAAALDGALYVAGGASLRAGPDGKVARTYLTDAYRYDPAGGWRRVADLPHPAVAAPSPAPAEDGAWYILGGDDGAQVGVAPGAHRGFPRQVLRYDAKADAWSAVAGRELPAGHVTAPCVAWRGDWHVVSGEVRPGIRSPNLVTFTP